MKKASELTDDELRILIAEDQGWAGVPARQYWNTDSKGKCYWSSEKPLEVEPRVVMSTLIARWLKQPSGQPVYTLTDGPVVNNYPTKSRHAVHEGFAEFEGSNLYSFRINKWPKVEPSLKGFIKYLPNYPSDLNAMREARATLRGDLELRVRYLNSLRTIVGKHCPTNKSGTAIVTDFDMLDATPREHAEAYVITRKLELP